MKIGFRLKEILEDHRVNRRGIIKEIAKGTGLERHQVAAVYHNNLKNAPLKVLEKICDYLVSELKVDAQTLPGGLFDRAPDSFWDLMAKRELLVICLGMRRREEEAWITVSDMRAQGTLLGGISQPGVANHRGPLQQRLVPAPDTQGTPARDEAHKVYQEFARKRNRALVGLGSIKINSVVEIMVAEAFGAEPFKARKPQVPFYFSYRPVDPPVPSCCGGIRPPRAASGKQPGIYYEQADGEWECCPWEEGVQDSALVFYHFEPAAERAEVVLAGFSGRATRRLADVLQDGTASFWPPSYSTPRRNVGAFVVQFSEPKGGKKPKASVISLAPEVLERRLKPMKG
jgi:hypothetical protein